jgi:hypothetical protein
MHFETLEFQKPSHAIGSGQAHAEVSMGSEVETEAVSMEARTIQKLRIRVYAGLAVAGVPLFHPLR